MADLTKAVTETLTLGEAAARGYNPLLPAAQSETLRLTDWWRGNATSALEAGIYDLVLGGGSSAVGKWQLEKRVTSGSNVCLVRFYTPAGGTFVVQLRLKVEAGEVLQLNGPNAGVLNAVRRWV